MIIANLIIAKILIFNLFFARQVLVEDVNDCAPQFHSLSHAVLMPGSKRGATVAVAAADDDDALSNGEVSYELEQRSGDGSAGVSFDIDRRSGRIFLSNGAAPQKFEPDTSSLATLTVRATDGAAQAVRMTSTTTLTVMAGRADPGPEFTQEVYRVSLRENSPGGTPVGKVALVEERRGGERPRFYLVGSESKKGRDRGLFEVDAGTGQVRTVALVDREEEGDKIVLDIIALFSNAMSKCKVNKRSTEKHMFGTLFLSCTICPSLFRSKSLAWTRMTLPQASTATGPSTSS